LTLLWAVNPAEADTLRALAVQNFDGVAVEDANDGAGEVGNGSERAEQEQERAESKDINSSPPDEWRRDYETHFR
jgi:hypothetical protein